MTTDRLNNLNEDSKIIYFDSLITVPLEDGEDNILKFRYFTLKKEIKMQILEKIYEARANNFKEPFVVLLPHKIVRTAPKSLPYPVPFWKQKIYIIPHIREIMVLEND